MTWTRRRATVLLACLVFTVGCSRRNHPAAPGGASPGAAGVPRSPPELTILYTSDLRGRFSPDVAGANGGLSRRATVVDRIRVAGTPVVQLDAGDLLSGAADAEIPDAPVPRARRTPMVLTGMGRMGVDVVALGERELELGNERLKAALKTAKLSVVSTNLLGKGAERPFPADQLIDAGGLSVGVFGILDLPAGQAAALESTGFRTGDPVEAIRTSTQSLRARGARLIVGLFHVTGGLARTREILAAAASDIDVVILGHGGEGLAPGTGIALGKTQIVHAGKLGAELGRLDVWGLAPGAARRYENQVYVLTNVIPEHVGVALIERVELEKIRSDAEQAAAELRRKNKQKDPPKVYENWTYASSTACAMCHKEATEQWNTTDHAQALATLKKNKHDREPACLGCHMTGYLQPGGTRSFETLMTYMANVGCESCHGPSVAHVRSPDKKHGTSRTVGPEVCLGCHTNDQNLGPFDYATAVKAILGPGHGALAVKTPTP